MSRLADLESVDIDVTIYRLANPPQPGESTAALLDTMEDVEATVQFRHAGRADPLAALLDAPFATMADTTYRPSPTRFSDGRRRVFYAALEPETCDAERAHWLAKEAGVARPGRSLHLKSLRCRLSGVAFDVRPKLSVWPFLVGEDDCYPRCQSLASNAVEQGAAAMLCPSARRTDGTTTPVFARDALSDPEIVASVTLSFDADGTIAVERT